MLPLTEVEVPLLPADRLAFRRKGQPSELDVIGRSLDIATGKRLLASVWLLDFESDVLVLPFVPTAIAGEFHDVVEQQVWPRPVREQAAPAAQGGNSIFGS